MPSHWYTTLTITLEKLTSLTMIALVPFIHYYALYILIQDYCPESSEDFDGEIFLYVVVHEVIIIIYFRFTL